MNYFILILVLTVFGFTQAYEKNDPILNNIQNIDWSDRIVGGGQAKNGQFRHVVNLRMVTVLGGLAPCAGSLITPRWVITASSCLFEKTIAIVGIGNVNVTTPELVLVSRELFMHPEYNNLRYESDIGLIFLFRVVQTTANIKPIRLPRLSTLGQSFENTIATISAYGFTSNSGPSSEMLFYNNVSIISNEDCEKEYGSTIVQEYTICSRGIGNTNDGICYGDYGGPLEIVEEDGEPTLLGVISFRSLQGCTNSSSGYMRTVHYLDWIKILTNLEIRP